MRLPSSQPHRRSATRSQLRGGGVGWMSDVGIVRIRAFVPAIWQPDSRKNSGHDPTEEAYPLLLKSQQANCRSSRTRHRRVNPAADGYRQNGNGTSGQQYQAARFGHGGWTDGQVGGAPAAGSRVAKRLPVPFAVNSSIVLFP